MAKPKANILFLLSLLLAQFPSFSQDSEVYRHRVDSVKAIVAKGANDTQMVDALNTLSMLAWRKGNYEESDAYSARALVHALKLGFDKGSAICYNNLGTVAWYKGDYNKALRYYLQSLTIMEKIGNQKGLSDAHNNIGMVHYYLGNYEKTIEYYYRSLRIDEQLGLEGGVALSHNNIGGVYDEIGNKKAEAGNYKEAAFNFDMALKEYQESMKISEKLNDKSNLALCYDNLGNVYSEKALLEEKAGRTVNALNFYDQAFDLHLRALKLKEEAGDKFGISGTNISLGEVCLSRRRYDEALAYFETGLKIGKELGAKERQKHAFSGMATAYEQKKDLKTAFQYRLLFTAMKDSIYNDDLSEQIAGMQTKYETEKKEQQIDLLNSEQEIQSARLGRQEAIIWSALFMLLVVIGSGTYAYNRFKIAKKQKRIIEGQKVQVEKAFNQLHEKNTEVLDSIHYARRIQRALITPEKYIARVLSKLTKSI